LSSTLPRSSTLTPAPSDETSGRAPRVKDFVDLVLIGEMAELDAKRLHQALAYAVLAREVGIADEIEVGHVASARLLDPVLQSEAGGHWDPEAQRWRSRA
jgi:hypothetical protein